MDNMALRYTNDLLTVNWDDVMGRTLPFMGQHRKNLILHVGGQFSINPLLLLGKVIQEENDISHSMMMSDQEFRMSIKSFANELSRYQHDFDNEDGNIGKSQIEYSLRKSFDDDQERMSEFLQICDSISKRYDISTQPATTNSSDLDDIVKRDEEEIELELPYASEECWQIGATHNAGSSIDMAPSLYQR